MSPANKAYSLVSHHERRDASFAVIEGAKPPSSASTDRREGASREGIQRPHELFAQCPPHLLLFRSRKVVRDSPRLRQCSSVVRNGEAVSSSRKTRCVFRTTTRSAHCRLWLSVHSVGVGHSEPPVKGSRLRSLEPSPERFAFWCANESQSDSSTLCPRRVQVSTPKQEVVRESKILVIPKISDFRTTLSSTSEGRVAPSAVGKGSSQAPLLSLVLPEVRELPPVVHGSVAESRPDERRRQEVDHQFGAKHR